VSTRQLLAVAALQLRLGLRPWVRILGGVLAGLVLLDVAARLVIGEPVPALAPWRLFFFVVLVPAFLAGVVRGEAEERAQSVLCPVVLGRRRFVLMGVVARTTVLLAVTGFLIALGRLMPGPGGGEEAGVRQLLTLLWVVELATVTAAFSLVIPGEGNAFATVVLLGGGFVVLLERANDKVPWLLAGLYPLLATPDQLSTAAVSAAAIALAAAVVLLLGVRERA